MFFLILFSVLPDTSYIEKEIAKADSLYNESYKDTTLLFRAEKILDSLLNSEILSDEVLWRKSYFCFEISYSKKHKEEKMEWLQKGQNFAKRAIQINPDNPEAHFWYASNLGNSGKLKGVLNSLFMVADLKKEAAKILDLKEDHAGAHVLLGEIYSSLPGFAGGNKDKAVEEYKKAIENDTLYTAAYSRLAKLYVGMKKYDEGRKILNKMLSLKGWRNPTHFHLYEKNEAEELLKKIEKK